MVNMAVIGSQTIRIVEDQGSTAVEDFIRSLRWRVYLGVGLFALYPVFQLFNQLIDKKCNPGWPVASSWV
ncbi:MAG: hypothetical protein ABSE95_04990 [Thermodesulfobacteriota bacterium]|jgi:hypothetical protein